MKEKIILPDDDKKIDLIKNINIFSTLNKKELNIIIDYTDCYSYKKEDKIYTEGSIVYGIFIISRGEVKIIKNNEDIAHFINGEYFHELDLLGEEPENTTAIAEKDSNLLIFPKKGTLLKDIILKEPVIFAKILHELLADISKRIRQANKIISERIPWIEDLRKKIKRDKLTGSYNRIFLEEDFPAILNESSENTSLIMIKPDNFKKINDTYGHDAGDNAIIFLSNFLKKTLRKNDITVRYRGDEFAVILPRTNIDEAINISKNLLNKIIITNIKDITKGEDCFLTFSIGAASYPFHAKDHHSLIKLTFDKMYEALKNGGNKVLYS